MGDGKERLVPSTGRSKPGKDGKPIPMKEMHTKNHLWWVDVVLNLPGDPDFDPPLPWVFKRRLDETIDGDIFSNIVDVSTEGSTEEVCWQCTKCSVCAATILEFRMRQGREEC